MIFWWRTNWNSWLSCLNNLWGNLSIILDWQWSRHSARRAEEGLEPRWRKWLDHVVYIHTAWTNQMLFISHISVNSHFPTNDCVCCNLTSRCLCEASTLCWNDPDSVFRTAHFKCWHLPDVIELTWSVHCLLAECFTRVWMRLDMKRQ